MSKHTAVATLHTNYGDIAVNLYGNHAPKTVRNFVGLATGEQEWTDPTTGDKRSDNLYDGVVFHRIIPGFMIQGGDPLSKDPALADSYGTGDPGYKIKAEFNDHKHVRGVLSMARAMDPDSAGSQFFIMLGDAPFLDGKYTAFGQLIKGDDVLTKISKTPTTMGPGGEPSKPTERVAIKSTQIVPRPSEK